MNIALLTYSYFQVLMVLEELNLPYEIKAIRFEDTKLKPFTDINPNGRVPGLSNYLNLMSEYSQYKLQQSRIQTLTSSYGKVAPSSNT